MNTMHQNARNVLTALIGLSLAPALAAETYCLTRDDEQITVQTITEAEEWAAHGGIVHFSYGNNADCTGSSGNPCRFGQFDLFYLQPQSSGLVRFSRYSQISLSNPPVPIDYLDMQIKENGRYLQGLSDPGTSFEREVFVFFNGTAHCSITQLPYDSNAICRFFTLEAYPTNGGQTSHRPDLAANDASAVVWELGTPCSGSLQDGGGRGHTPP